MRRIASPRVNNSVKPCLTAGFLFCHLSFRLRSDYAFARRKLRLRSLIRPLLALSRRGGQTVLMDCLLFRPFDSHIHSTRLQTKTRSFYGAGWCGANDGNRSALAIIITAHILGLTSVPHIGALLALSRRGGQTVLMDCLLFRPFDSHIRRQVKTKRPSRVRRSLVLERMMGIEPTTAAWEAAVLPLNYIRVTACVAFA